MTPQVIAVVGATATGKSDLALDLAVETGGGLVCDPVAHLAVPASVASVAAAPGDGSL